MNSWLGYIDFLSYFCAVIFLLFAFKIRQKLMLPQHNILLIIGILLFLSTGSHIPGYLPEIFPPIDEFYEHFIRDTTLLGTSIVLLYYGYSTYRDVIKSSPKSV